MFIDVQNAITTTFDMELNCFLLDKGQIQTLQRYYQYQTKFIEFQKVKQQKGRRSQQANKSGSESVSKKQKEKPKQDNPCKLIYDTLKNHEKKFDRIEQLLEATDKKIVSFFEIGQLIQRGQCTELTTLKDLVFAILNQPVLTAEYQRISRSLQFSYIRLQEKLKKNQDSFVKSLEKKRIEEQQEIRKLKTNKPKNLEVNLFPEMSYEEKQLISYQMTKLHKKYHDVIKQRLDSKCYDQQGTLILNKVEGKHYTWLKNYITQSLRQQVEIQQQFRLANQEKEDSVFVSDQEG